MLCAGIGVHAAPSHVAAQAPQADRFAAYNAVGTEVAVTSTSKEATEAALWALAQGGNAADAYLTAALTQTGRAMPVPGPRREIGAFHNRKNPVDRDSLVDNSAFHGRISRLRPSNGERPRYPRGPDAMRNVLITGGAGFIGSHLAETLLQRGCAVQVIDDLSTGCEQNIAHLRQNPAFSFVRDTVIHREVTTELIARADMVFHLAAAVGVHLIIEQPVRTIETNIACTEIILELCAQRRTPVLLASTSEVYGKLQREKFREDDDLVLGPTSRSRWCYASSKIIDEFLAKAYYNEQGLPAVVARFFNTIGPRQTGRYGMVVPRFIDRALRGAPITVYGDGTQQRSFTWVGDVVDAILELMDKPSAMGEVFNIGHHEEVSIGDLARLIRDLTGSSSKIELVPYEKALGSGFEDIPRRLPDLTKIEDFISYRPTRNLRAMLEEILTYRRRETHGVSKASNVGPQDLTSGNIPSQR